MNDIPYTVIRSSRKTFGLEIKGGQLLVRVPQRATARQIRQFLAEHEDWIQTHMAKAEAQKQAAGEQPPLTAAELRELAAQAKKVIPERVAYYAPLIGVSYGRITIRSQHTRWGSCSSKGNLNFNCLLMLTPPEVIDSVVVHELCHRKEMNHSARFYAEVRRVFPEYDRWRKWLKDNGGALMARLAAGEQEEL